MSDIFIIASMNVIFLTMAPIADVNVREIYPDLLREFVRNGHKV